MTPRRALSYCLAALAFALPLSIAGTNVALAATSACLLWLLAIPGGRPGTAKAMREAARTPVFLALAAYAAWGLVASLAGLDPAGSLRLFPKDAHKLWAFLAISAAVAAAESIPVAAPFAAGLGLHAAVGILQAAFQWSAGEERVRAHGFLHPVAYGEVLGLGLIGAAAYLARSNAEPSRRRSAAVLLAAASAALVLSQARAVVFALGAAFAAACLLEPRWRRHSLKAGLLLLSVVVFWEIMPTNGRTFRSLISSNQETRSHRARFVLWDVAVRIARDRPITGVGPGQYRRAFELYHPEKLDSEGTWGNAHNLYFHHLAERGVPGLLVLLGVLGAFMAGAWRAARARRDVWSLWATAAAAAFLVMNMTEVAWQTEQVATLFFFAWLLGTGPRSAREIL
jgi:O-antigen ligase